MRGAVSIRDEQRSLFSGKRSSSITQTPTRKLRKTITWTNKFVCLSGNKVPATSTSKMQLLLRTLIAQFKEELTKHFPKLKDCGGSDVRCIPNSRNLERQVGNGRPDQANFTSSSVDLNSDEETTKVFHLAM